MCVPWAPHGAIELRTGELAPVEKVNLTCPTREVFDPTYYPRNTEPMVDYRVFSLPCFRIA